MDDFAQRPPRERAEVFEETAMRRGIGRPAIIEKDFWVCWTLLQLRELFGRPAVGAAPPGNHESAGLLFKGGTSLSKVYGAIKRFSEDIDLTIDREALGFGQDTETSLRQLSRTKREQLLNEEVAQASARYVSERVGPLLSERLEKAEDRSPNERSVNGASPITVDRDDPQTLHLAYPRSLTDSAYTLAEYIPAEVRLEFGARGELWPAHRAIVRPYVAEEFGNLFAHPVADVNVLDISRTFWEKATILHQIAHVGISASRSRLSRHYYDLAELAATPQGQAALGQKELLLKVAEHKSMFFPQTAAKYELARPGTLRLLPPEETISVLRRDYMAMGEMFFGAPPSFEGIVQTLRHLEGAINAE